MTNEDNEYTTTLVVGLLKLAVRLKNTVHTPNPLPATLQDISNSLTQSLEALHRHVSDDVTDPDFDVKDGAQTEEGALSANLDECAADAYEDQIPEQEEDGNAKKPKKKKR